METNRPIKALGAGAVALFLVAGVALGADAILRPPTTGHPAILTADETREAAATAEPTETPEAPRRRPKPTEAPEVTETAEPAKTAEPKATAGRRALRSEAGDDQDDQGENDEDGGQGGHDGGQSGTSGHDGGQGGHDGGRWRRRRLTPAGPAETGPPFDPRGRDHRTPDDGTAGVSPSGPRPPATAWRGPTSRSDDDPARLRPHGHAPPGGPRGPPGGRRRPRAAIGRRSASSSSASRPRSSGLVPSRPRRPPRGRGCGPGGLRDRLSVARRLAR